MLSGHTYLMRPQDRTQMRYPLPSDGSLLIGHCSLGIDIWIGRSQTTAGS
jgi:hypothetical protein